MMLGVIPHFVFKWEFCSKALYASFPDMESYETRFGHSVPVVQMLLNWFCVYNAIFNLWKCMLPKKPHIWRHRVLLKTYNTSRFNYWNVYCSDLLFPFLCLYFENIFLSKNKNSSLFFPDQMCVDHVTMLTVALDGKLYLVETNA